jgi:hypothetical protein
MKSARSGVCGCLPHARGARESCADSELVFGSLTQNRSSFEPVPPPSANRTPKILGCMPNSMLFRPAFHSQNQQQRDRRSQCAACRRPAWCATTFSGPDLALQELVRMVPDPRCRAGRQSRQIQEKAQDYSGFGLKSQTPARRSAQLSLSRPRVRQPPPSERRSQMAPAHVALRIQYFGAALSSSNLRDDCGCAPLHLGCSIDHRVNADQNVRRPLFYISNHLRQGQALRAA